MYYVCPHRTCPIASFSAAGSTGCSSCPAGMDTLLPGSVRSEQCRSQAELDKQLGEMFNKQTLVAKLVSIPALDLKETQAKSGK